MSDRLTALLDERNEIERQAIAWAERWKALRAEMGGDPQSALIAVRPITFHQEELDRHLAECSVLQRTVSET